VSSFLRRFAGLGAVLFCLAPTLEAYAAPPPVASAPAAAQAKTPPPWLRAPKKATPPLETRRGIRPERVALTLAVVAGLGVAALYARRRRQKGAPALARTPLRISDVTRVGPKAQVVVANIDGRRLLLGVTEQSVNALGWLEPEAEARESAGESAGGTTRASEIFAAGAREPVGVSRSSQGGFLKVLRSAATRVSVDEVAAPVDRAAGETRDAVQLSRRAVEREQAQIEGQAAGLLRRIKGQNP